MDENTKQLAAKIIVKPNKDWTKSDNEFIWDLLKSGHRDALKALRNEVLLAE